MLFASSLMLVLFGVFWADAYPNGAPMEACDTLTPLHDNYTSQTTRVPFTVDLSQFEKNGTYQYTPSKKYTGKEILQLSS